MNFPRNFSLNNFRSFTTNELIYLYEKTKQTERKNWRKDHPKNFIAKPMTGLDGTANLLKWECRIPGREGSPWAGGEYIVRLDFPCKLYFVIPPFFKWAN